MEITALGEIIKISLPNLVLYGLIILLFIYLFVAMFLPERFT